MTFRIGDSFDHYDGASGGNFPLERLYTQNDSSALAAYSMSLVAGRFGGQAVRVSYTDTFTVALPYLNRPLWDAVSELTMSFAFRRSDYNLDQTGDGVVIARLRTGSAIQLIFGVDFLGRLLVGRTNFTTELLGRSAPLAFQANKWDTLDLEIGIDDSAGFVRAYSDGPEALLSLSGVDTKAQAISTTVDNFDLCCHALVNGAGYARLTTDFDDLHFLDEATRLPQPVKSEPLYPVSDSGPNQWTRNTGASDYAAIDEAVVDGDTTYLAASTVGHKSRHGLSNLSSTPAAIYALQAVTVARKDDAGTRQIRTNLISGATTENGHAQTLAINYGVEFDIAETDPDTDAAWNASGVNSLEVEVEVVT